MSGHLCLKWNNHSSAFLTSIGRIQLKSRFCDATIACQGKYFPVHRMILSTCSEYFDELFDRMQCQHPYIVFKDIEPKEMELLLNYMYQGEVNVVQEMLPTLIKAAEALKIKGLAVSDDIPSKDTSSPGRKRSSTSSNKDNDQPKRTLEESRKRRRLVESSSVAGRHANNESSDDSSRFGSTEERQGENNSVNLIKQEPSDTMAEYEDTSMGTEYNMGLPPPGGTMELLNKEEIQESSSAYIKTENPPDTEEVYTDQAGWSDFGSESAIGVIETSEMGSNDDISVLTRGGVEEADPEYKNDTETQNERETETDWRNSIFQNVLNFSSSSSVTAEATSGATAGTEAAPTAEPKFHHCPYCTYGSRYPAHVKRHVMHKHTGERPYSCTICGSRFTEKGSVTRHMRTHTGEKAFACQMCSKKFSEKLALWNHVEQFHA